MVIKNSLHVSCWNINGFKLKGYNKYSDSDFISEFNKKDIFCLLETHCSLEDALEIPDFKAVHLIRPMSARTRKRSGGISVYVRSTLRPGIKFLKHKTNDYIWLKLYTHISSLFEEYNPDFDIPVRHSQDSILSKRGKTLNDLCVQTGIRILNGRTPGDYIGQLTCHTPMGSSVVDYFLSSESLLSNILFFKVHDFKADLSDHCQVSTMLKVNCIFNAVQKDVYSIPNQYIWEENSAEKFQNALASPLVQEKIKTFNNTNYTGDSNIMIQDLNNILYEAANISIKKKIIKKVNSTAKVKKSQQSKWFDLPLINMKKQLCDKEKLFKKYNKDPYIRSSFFALLKKYRKARKTKYREFRADLIDQLDNLREENPKSYWTLLESLKNSDKKTEKSSNITSTEWAEYFKDLNKKPVTPSPNIIEFLRNLENAKVFTELDILITDKEISDAIHTLKNKKSCGPDSISNEMIKNSQSFLIKSLNHVFNKILSTGNYPQIWANGFITALFKNGSKDDPSNYRGLTVTSCLSKTVMSEKSSGVTAGLGIEDSIRSAMLNKLLGSGSYESFDMRCMVTGQFSVGKSSLVKLLVGDNVPEGRQATDGITLIEGRCGLDIETRNWIMIDPATYNALDVVYNKVLMTSIEEDETKQAKTPENQEPDAKPVDSQNAEDNPSQKSQATKSTSWPVNDSSEPSTQPQTAQTLSPQMSSSESKKQQMKKKMTTKMTKKEIRKRMEKVLKSGKYKMKVGRLIFWDFGGQYVYYTTHQTFMTFRALFLVVFDGSKRLNEEVPDVLCFPGQHMTPTPAVFLLHWVNSILTYCKVVYAGIPKILFVATHKDKVPVEDVETRRALLYSEVEELFKDHEGRTHLVLDKQIFVNATDKNDQEIETLKKAITELTFDHPCWGGENAERMCSP
ncbi:unnamed protein product [Mytilus edulis]|uniref:Uncharacterized protein n=1 Tax=Mytilus edulis TaxID=6550 RepID=A0A8S3PS75_MYTED|nr:unnamed protein product [Mytilus edulis]